MKAIYTVALAAFLWGAQGGFVGAQTANEVPLERVEIDAVMGPENADFTLKGSFLRNLLAPTQNRFAARIDNRLSMTRQRARLVSEIAIEYLDRPTKDATLRIPLKSKWPALELEGDSIRHWGIEEADGEPSLIVLPQDGLTTVRFSVVQSLDYVGFPQAIEPGWPSVAGAEVVSGAIGVSIDDTLKLNLSHREHLLSRPVEEGEARRYVFYHPGYSLRLSLENVDPNFSRIVFEDFHLEGRFIGDGVRFELSGVAHLKDPRGGRIELLSGAVALSEWEAPDGVSISVSNEGYQLRLSRDGAFPIRVEFDARVSSQDGWSAMDFEPVSATPRQAILRGLPDELEFSQSMNVERNGSDARFSLGADGPFNPRWRDRASDDSGALFYSVSSLESARVGAGLLEQEFNFEMDVAQGELNEIAITIIGRGEIVAVEGARLLSWNIEENAENRILRARLNQPELESYQLYVRSQNSLPAFPTEVEPLRLEPVDAIRHSGWLRVSSRGATRLETLTATGLTQVSPTRFPASERFALDPEESASFAFRHSGRERSLVLQADKVAPEVNVSQAVLYELTSSGFSISGEYELEILKAPLREFSMRLPSGYLLSMVQGSNVADYFVTETDDGQDLRLVFSGPVEGRRILQLRLEKDEALRTGTIEAPRIELVDVDSTRGAIGVVVEAGYRVESDQIEGVVETPNNLFPKRVEGLQVAYKIQDKNWSIRWDARRLERTIQTDVTHLYSFSPGVVYSSSVAHYLISGAPVNTLRVRTPEGARNVEFEGAGVRDWRLENGAYSVQFQTPLHGTFTLLTTYDLTLDETGDEFDFVGARPLDVNSEQGYVALVSYGLFDTEPVSMGSNGSLLKLESAEIPSEVRALTDAPFLAAYQYSGRPFELTMRVGASRRAESVERIIDRATFSARLSGEGDVVSEAMLFLKSKNAAPLRFKVPEGAEVWSLEVDGRPVTPVVEAGTMRIPIPVKESPDELIRIEASWAEYSENSKVVDLRLPEVDAPMLATSWSVAPDPGNTLRWISGAWTPDSVLERRGPLERFWDQLWRDNHGELGRSLIGALALAFGAIIGLRMVARGDGGARPGLGRWAGFALACGLGALSALVMGRAILEIESHSRVVSHGIEVSAPALQAGFAPGMRVENVAAPARAFSFMGLVTLVAGIAVGFSIRKMRDPNGRRLALAGALTLGALGAAALGLGPAALIAVFLLYFVFGALGPLMWGFIQSSRAPRLDSGATVAGLALGLLGALCGSSEAPAQSVSGIESVSSVVSSVGNSVEVEARFSVVLSKGEWLALIPTSAAIESREALGAGAEFVEMDVSGESTLVVSATDDVAMEIALNYITPAEALPGGGYRARLLTYPGIVNRLQIDLGDENLEISGGDFTLSQAVDGGASSSVVLTMMAKRNAAFRWRPRERDAALEALEYFAETETLWVPGAGAVDGYHWLRLRIAQGALSEFVAAIPEGLSILNVEANGLSHWRYSPDDNEVVARFDSPMTGGLEIWIQSQKAVSAPPYSVVLQAPSAASSVEEIGMIGIATDKEIQLESSEPTSGAVLNLEDFPVSRFAGRIPQGESLGIRRAYRSMSRDFQVDLSATEVTPDIRVVTSESMALSEDRISVNARVEATIARRGVFSLRMSIPSALTIESISGPNVSHWTRRSDETNQSIATIHFIEKTEGSVSIQLALSGPGIGEAVEWRAPRIVALDARKQSGAISIQPERGLRLFLNEREGASLAQTTRRSSAPESLAFRWLRKEASLVFGVEREDPWIRVASLFDASIGEAFIEYTALLDYEIEKSAVGSLRVELPADAESVRFFGDRVAGFDEEPSAEAGTLWVVNLDRRTLGSLRLQVQYKAPNSESESMALRGPVALDADLQRAFAMTRATGRWVATYDELPEGVRRVDRRSVPESLRRALTARSASVSFQLFDPRAAIVASARRLEVSRTLPARVVSARVSTVVTENLEGLFQARVSLYPQDKRTLSVTLPEGAVFWFATVNQNAVETAFGGPSIEIALEKRPDESQPSEVVFVYFAPSLNSGNAMRLELMGPQFDLPLEDIEWEVLLPDHLHPIEWEGRFELDRTEALSDALVSLDQYLGREARRIREQTAQAEAFLEQGAQLAERGEQVAAREAFRNAYNLSNNDLSLNEDAKIQLRSVKNSQAMVALNVQRMNALGDVAPQVLENPDALNQTPEQTKAIFGANSPSQNEAIARVAERLVERQESSWEAPVALSAQIPRVGARYVFRQNLQVDPSTEMRLGLRAKWRDGKSAIPVVVAGVVLFLLIWTVSHLAPKMALQPTATKAA